MTEGALVAQTDAMPMAVVQVIDDSDVLHALSLQGLHHREQVLGFTEPIPVVIQTYLATLRGAGLSASTTGARTIASALSRAA